MSQRATVISIIAILAFVGTTLFAADHIAGRMNNAQPVLNCPQAQSAPETDRFNHAMAYAIYSSLDQANTRELIIATKQHPDLAPELRYQSFAQTVHLHRSFKNLVPGMMKITPLAEDPFFTTDFIGLRDRYQREHPADHDPIE